MLWMLFTEILYRPIFNILVVFLAIFGGNLGIAIVLLTVLVRSLLINTTSAWNDMQKGMWALQPKLTEIQEKYKDDPKKLSEETMKVFKTDGKWAFKWCLMMLVQIPVFIGLYTIIWWVALWQIKSFWHVVPFADLIYAFFNGFGHIFTQTSSLTNWIINTNFLGIDLLTSWSEIFKQTWWAWILSNPSFYLTILAWVFTYLQTKLTTLAKPATPNVPGQNVPDMGKMMWFMNIFLVFMIGSFVFSMKAWVGLYMVTTTMFSVGQYSWQYRALLRAKWIEFTSKGKGIVINPK